VSLLVVSDVAVYADFLLAEEARIHVLNCPLRGTVEVVNLSACGTSVQHW